ncbi:helix-turn-helix transcriptional regulator [uncultured Dokdonia sp.]|uniref:helix-turn-helix domain-containing protein n=1 Tax=uncultured Dokdonia sp. TaxID=575653 RepID=UPI00260C0288|nr:helix-turn-helix transcriptional regulator [uncultured Dokdonia sp.]
MSFTLLDVILFLGVSQGIFLAITLRFIDNRNKVANDVLSITIGIAVIMLFGRVMAYRIEALWVNYVAGIVDVTIFLFGPLIYCYIRRLLFQETPVFKLSFWHYLIACIHICITIGIYIAPENVMIYIKEIQFLPYFWFFSELIGIVSFVVYTIASIRLFRKHKKMMEYQVSYILAVRRYIRYVLVTIILFTVLWLISFISGIFKFSEISTVLNYPLVWISIPLFIYVIGYYSLRQPEIFRMPLRPKIKEEKARLKPDEIQRLQKRLNFFIQEEEIYKASDLSLKALAEKLNTTPNNLSWLLNQVYQKSFYDYINTHRVQDILESIDRELHRKQTLLAIAFDAGFNSKSTFNKAFKQVTSQTPSAYIKSKKVA